ncbi:MAG: response regulator [Nitrospirota bacterium]
MILTCACGAKLKISDEKLTEAGVKIKCPKCGTVHLAKKPATASATPSAAPAMPWFASGAPAQPAGAPPAAPPSPPVQAPAGPAAEPAMPWFAPSPAAPSSALVLVAHDSQVVVDMIRGVVSAAGLSVEHAPDGLDALKKATALKPQVMIVDVGLTGIYGFELCERLKGDPDTRGIKIILLSSVYGLTAYKRNPVTLYGADDYIEKHHIPDKLVPKIKQLLSGAPPASAAPAAPAAEQGAPAQHQPPPPAPVERPVPVTLSSTAQPATPADANRALQDMPDILPKVPVTLGSSPKRPVSSSPPPVRPKTETPKAPDRPVNAAAAQRGPERPAVPMQDESVKLDASFFEQEEYVAPSGAPAKVAVDPQEVEKARRFARLVVSDIVLYNQEAVAEGIAKGTFFDLLKDDITEGRSLYEKRVPESVRSTQDYFQEAFDNFIASKKKQR